MTRWTDHFIALCLEGLPRDHYRSRVQQELADHLLALTQELEEGGLSPKEARERAVVLMGDPETLNRDFQAQWLQWASNWNYLLSSLLKGAGHSLMVNVLVRWMIALPIALFLRNLQLVDGAVLPILYTILIITPGLWFTSYELYSRFYLHPRRRCFIFMGCLTVWALDGFLFAGAAVGLFGDMISLFLFLLALGHFPTILLFYRTAFPFYPYLATSLVICFLFGLFYHRKTNTLPQLSD